MVTPNLFIALQIVNSAVKSKLRAVQNHVISGEPKLARAMVESEKSHVTLMVLNSLEVNVNEIGNKIGQVAERFEPFQMNIKSIGNFGNKVVFANVDGCMELAQLHKSLIQALSEMDCVALKKEGALKPHVTLMKMSRVRNRALQKFKIDPALYEKYQDCDFGTETVASVQLLSMVRPADSKTGYYHKFLEVPLGCHVVVDSTVLLKTPKVSSVISSAADENLASTSSQAIPTPEPLPKQPNVEEDGEALKMIFKLDSKL